MLNILLFIQIVIAMLLIIVILIQRTGADGVSGLASGNNMGVVSARAKANFLTKTTMILAFLFLFNSIILANLSSKASNKISTEINFQNIDDDNSSEPQESDSKNSDSLPIAN